jgi:hypothetical protein
LEVTHGVGRLMQRIGLVDDGRQAAALDELGETFEVGVVLFRGLHGEPLTHERRQRGSPQLAPESSGPAAPVFAADDDERPAPGERASEP